MAIQTSQSSSRLVYIDFARVLAILFMIQGHAIDVLLAPAYRGGFLYNGWLFLRGLTAPTFFVLSGMSFMIASSRRWDSYLRPSRPLFKRLARFGSFIFLGYLMHLPVKSLQSIPGLGAEGWQSWLQVDVLQCIGVTLICLQLLILLVKTPARLAKVAAGLGAGLILLTPVLWKVAPATHLPLVVTSYFTGSTGSLFPLMPWSGYVLFGIVLGFIQVRGRETLVALPSCPLLAWGSLLVLTGYTLQNLPVTIYQNLDYWRTSPNLFLTRVGLVCLILAGVSALTRKIWLPRREVRSLAEESLTIYFVHICILYGSLWNAGLRQRMGATLSPLLTFEWIALLLISMVLLGWGWNRFKHAEPTHSHFVRAAIALAIAYSFT